VLFGTNLATFRRKLFPQFTGKTPLNALLQNVVKFLSDEAASYFGRR